MYIKSIITVIYDRNAYTAAPGTSYKSLKLLRENHITLYDFPGAVVLYSMYYCYNVI